MGLLRRFVQHLGELFGHFQQDAILFALSHFDQRFRGRISRLKRHKGKFLRSGLGIRVFVLCLRE